MKKIIKVTALVVCALLAPGVKAQLQISPCAGSVITMTAVNSLGLTSPSYSLNPGGITFPGPTCTAAPVSNVSYTLYVTGTNSNGTVVTTSNTVNVLMGNPTFSITSTNNLLGCGSQSATVLNITNANTAPFAGGALSFAFIAPGNSTVLTNGSFGVIPSCTAVVPGTWTMVAQDLVNSCTTWSTFPVLQNTVAPSLSVSAVTRTLSCNTPSVILAGSSPNNVPGSVSYKWGFMNGANPNTIPNASMVATTSTYVAMSSTVLGNYTLTVTDNTNSCVSSSVVTLWQNVSPPIATINGASAAGCSTLQLLANGSVNTSTAFPGALGNSVILWNGPAPQATAALTATYSAQATGIYFMTVIDQNNGCTSTATATVVLSPSAAFAHTITGGQVTFSNAATNTDANTSYYWDFGDGNTSLLQNPTHTYINGGAHLVKFKVTNPGIVCSDSVIQSINVSGLPCSANSGFSMVPTATAQVWNVIPDYPWNISAASWDWGDGSFSNTLYTSHQYATAGIYNICLSVTVSCAATSTSCTSYNVYRGAQQNMVLQVNVVAPALISGLPSITTDGAWSWDIVPNPNAGTFKLNLATAHSEPIHVFISDLTGRILQDQVLDGLSTSASITTGDLPSGMYLVTLQSGDLKVSRRMVVNR